MHPCYLLYMHPCPPPCTDLRLSVEDPQLPASCEKGSLFSTKYSIQCNVIDEEWLVQCQRLKQKSLESFADVFL